MEEYLIGEEFRDFRVYLSGQNSIRRETSLSIVFSREREKNNNKRKLKKEREVKGNGELSNLGERGKGEMDTCRVETVGYLLFLRLKMWREMESLFCCEL